MSCFKIWFLPRNLKFIFSSDFKIFDEKEKISIGLMFFLISSRQKVMSMVEWEIDEFDVAPFTLTRNAKGHYLWKYVA